MKSFLAQKRLERDQRASISNNHAINRCVKLSNESNLLEQDAVSSNIANIRCTGANTSNSGNIRTTASKTKPNISAGSKSGAAKGVNK